MKKISYKCSTDFEAGVFYAPYIPLSISSITIKQFEEVRTLEVGGVIWHTVVLTKDASDWIQDTYSEDEGELWFHSSDYSPQVFGYTYLNVDEIVYTALVLRWS